LAAAKRDTSILIAGNDRAVEHPNIGFIWFRPHQKFRAFDGSVHESGSDLQSTRNPSNEIDGTPYKIQPGRFRGLDL
jgi:hypothetical protein